MEFVSKVGDLLLVNEGTEALVTDCIEYQGDAYLKLGFVVEKGESHKYQQFYAKEIVTPAGKYGVQIESDEELIKDLDEFVKVFRKSEE